MYNNITAIVVDDSNFSQKLIEKQLGSMGINVVSTAYTVNDAISKVEKFRPDLITMDITLPDGDGLECAKHILEDIPDINIIIVSATKDEKLSMKAKKMGIKTFLQKPISNTELAVSLENIFGKTDLFKQLLEGYPHAFEHAIKRILQNSINATVSCELKSISPDKIKSSGVSVTIGVNGAYKGSLLIDTSIDTALKISSLAYPDVANSEEDAIDYWADIANVIAGHAVSVLNDINPDFLLKLTPPTLFRSNDMIVMTEGMITNSYDIITPQGNIFVSVGFRKGID